MWSSLSVQLSAFVYSIFTGALLGILYDCIRVLRALFAIASYTDASRKWRTVSLPLIGSVYRAEISRKTKPVRLFLLGIGDVFFALLAGCTFSVFLYHCASGVFRWFYLFGCGVGFFSYYFTVGKAVMRLTAVLSFSITAVWRYAVFLFLLPLRGMIYLARRIFAWIRCRVFVPIARVCTRRRQFRYTKRVRAALADIIRFSGDY